MVPVNKILPGNAPGAGASAVIVPPLTFTSDLRNPLFTSYDSDACPRTHIQSLLH